MAAQNVSGYIRAQVALSEVINSSLQVNATISGQISPSYEYSNGATNTALAINQAYVKGASPQVLNSGASVTLALTSIADELGRTISFANGVRGLVIQVTSRTAGDYLLVGGAAANAWTGLVSTGTATIKVFDFAAFAVGSTDKYAATNGSNEQVKILNGGSNPITFKIAVWGNA